MVKLNQRNLGLYVLLEGWDKRFLKQHFKDARGNLYDGGYGNEQTPTDLNSIYDLQTIPGLLKKRGYKKAEIEGILSGNFLNFLRKNLPA